MASLTQPLSELVDVEVQVNPQAAASPTFNLGLIVGTNTTIPSVGANSRVRLYSTSDLAQMLTDGFLTTSGEYIAATLYAAAVPLAPNVLIGRQDLTALGTVTPTSGNAGTGFVVGDVVGVTHAGASGGFAKVITIGGSGAVTSLAPILGQQGTGYVVSTGNATTGGSGTGLEVDIATIGETPLQAMIACRAANADWYLCGSTTAVKADHIAIAEWAQTATPQCEYFFYSADADVLTGLTSSVGGVLTAGQYNRWQGVYKTTQSGLFPNDIYIWAAAMGKAMGLNTGLANSYFALPNKPLVGIAVEPLTPAQVATIQSQNMSVYVDYNHVGSFASYTPAKTGSGQYFDQILGLDMIGSDLQYGIANLLASLAAITLTDAGMTEVLNAVNQACELSVARGFIATGIWNGPQVLNLKPGMSVPNGYLAQCQKVSTQSPSDRAQRKGLPVYVCIVLAEAMASIVIGVYVQP